MIDAEPSHVPELAKHLPHASASARALAHQTFSRVAGAPLVAGNAVEILIDGRANFDAWRSAIARAQSSILLENYIFDESDLTRGLRDLLTERAAAGVKVMVIRDWLGCLGSSSDRFWNPLRAAGGEVRTFNPFRFVSPFGWFQRDHRKLLVVDSEVAFVSGVCASAKWLGDPARPNTAWRDTGVAVRGPALLHVARAFAETWSRIGEALPANLPVLTTQPPAVGSVSLRVVATSPGTTSLYRLDQTIAALAQHSLWLTDAYFVGFAPYVQALSAAARDGVDVRLLVPGTSDLPAIGALSRSGYRLLLEAGVRVFEWNGAMLHAKSAVADGRWARIGSTNLNVASWMGNCEIDIAVDDEIVGRAMQVQYEHDLLDATEIVLHGAHRVKRRERQTTTAKLAGATSGNAAASALRLVNTVGAAIAHRRELAPAEKRILLLGAAILLAIAVAAVFEPRLLAWPISFVAGWSALALLVRYLRADGPR